MNLNDFLKELEKIKINLDSTQIQQLNDYFEILIEENKKYNLTNIIEKDQVYLKHFYDSLTMIKIIDLNSIESLCDIGTGAGFPGLVLKIVFPNLNITLVDSLNKRINFLNIVIERLGLKKIKTIHSRAEDFSNNNVEKYDIVTARAVAHLSTLLEISTKAIKINGYFIAMKANINEEINESKNAIEKLNLKIEDIIEFELPIEKSKRTLIKLKKIGKTNNKYPRKIAEMKKQRL